MKKKIDKIYSILEETAYEFEWTSFAGYKEDFAIMYAMSNSVIQFFNYIKNYYAEENLAFEQHHQEEMMKFCKEVFNRIPK